MTLLNKNRIKAILFDLDGTLLEIEMQKYIPIYAASLASCLQGLVAVDKTVDAIFSAIHALIARESGRSSNASYFHRHIGDRLGLDAALVERSFAGFFSDGLSILDPLMQPISLARTVIEQSQERGLTVVIATNPVFPEVVVESRLARAGLADFDFQLVTSYENCSRCKPNPDYFSAIMARLNLPAEACLMVGNDTKHDLAARKLGIPTFLVDTWLIDRCQGEFKSDLRGDHATLLEFIMTIDKRR